MKFKTTVTNSLKKGFDLIKVDIHFTCLLALLFTLTET